MFILDQLAIIGYNSTLGISVQITPFKSVRKSVQVMEIVPFSNDPHSTVTSKLLRLPTPKPHFRGISHVKYI